MRARTRFVMLPAIQFDGQANRRRIEIEDATAHDVLAKKANAIDLTQPQVLPEFAFGQRLVAAQLARASFHGCVIHHDLDSFRAVQATKSNLPHPSSPLSRVRGKQSIFPSEHQQKPSPSRASRAFATLRPSFRRGKQSITTFLQKGEDKHNASRSFTPFGTKGVDAKRRGDAQRTLRARHRSITYLHAHRDQRLTAA